MNIQQVGVIGAGVMGRGVAQNLAQTGFQVVLVDVSQDILDQATEEIKQTIRLHKLLGQQQSTEPPEEVLARITGSTDYESLATVDYVYAVCPRPDAPRNGKNLLSASR